MSKLITFENPTFGKIRTLRDEKGEPVFCAMDICLALGYSKPQNAVAMHVEKCDTLKQGITDNLGRIQQTTFVTESGMYALIFGSKLAKAKEFKHWVTSEILPNIRKNGAYSVTPTSPLPLNTKRVRAALAWVEGVGDMLRLNDASKLSFLGKVANTFNLPLPDYTPSHGLLKSASELLKDCGSALNARQFNQLAMQGGYLTELSRRSTGGTEKKFKSITAKGLPYGENQVNPQNPRYTQPLWYADKFSALLQTLTPIPQANKR